jgi:hypothetical protein
MLREGDKQGQMMGYQYREQVCATQACQSLQLRSSENLVLVLEHFWVSKESVEKELEKIIGMLAITRCMDGGGERAHEQLT